MNAAEPCWICGLGPHEPFKLHAAQPQGEPVWPVIDGYPLGGHR